MERHKLNDEPVAVDISVPIVFRLDGSVSKSTGNASINIEPPELPELEVNTVFDAPPEPINGFKSIQGKLNTQKSPGKLELRVVLSFKYWFLLRVKF